MSRNPEYDVTLDGIGLILSRDGLGVQRVQANPYAMKSSSGERTYADLDEWAVFQVSSCHRGMGQERYGDPEQFWYSTGADTRFKDKIICGPQVNVIDAATDIGGASGAYNLFFAHFGNRLFVSSDDGVHEIFSFYTASTIAFVNATSKITDSANRLGDFATGETIVVSGSTDNDGTYTIATGGVAGEIVVSETLTDEAAGAEVTITKSAPTMEGRYRSVGKPITDLLAFNGYIYSAHGSGNTMRKSANGYDWSDVGGTPSAQKLYMHGGYLYRSLNQVVYYSSDPDAATPTWSDAIYVGDSQYIVQSMCTYQNSLIVFKNDGAWRIPGNPGDLDTPYRVPELDWRKSIHSNNGTFSTVWSDGFLYVTVEKAGLLRWTGRTVTPMGPDTLLIGVLKGQLTGLVSTPNFLYTILAGGASTSNTPYVLAWNGSGWHCVFRASFHVAKNLYYHDTYLYYGGHAGSPYQRNQIRRAYIAQGCSDPTQDPDYAYSTSCHLHLSQFTADMHETYKELRSITLWLDNQGGTATSGNQSVSLGIAVDRAGTTGDGSTSFTVYDNGQHIFKWDLTPPSPTFSDKQIASVNATRDAVTLAAGYDYSDIDLVGNLTSGTRTWTYFEDVNEYRNIISKTAPNTLNLQCPLNGTPAANTWMRPGIQQGRFVWPYLVLNTVDSARTPVVLAVVLKYLVNIKDYDLWSLSVEVTDPLMLRNGTTKRQPIADQLARLDEVRKKGRITFVDEVGDSHTVKVTNYSLEPRTQRTDSKMEAQTSYVARLTLLEV